MVVKGSESPCNFVHYRHVLRLHVLCQGCAFQRNALLPHFNKLFSPKGKPGIKFNELPSERWMSKENRCSQMTLVNILVTSKKSLHPLPTAGL